MNTDIFRKVALARLASPEQLDQLLRVTTPNNWVALVAAFALLGVAVLWGYQGSIPTKASGQGVILRSGGLLSIVSPGTGMVRSLNVKVGDKVRERQVIAVVAQPALAEQIKSTRQALVQLTQAREQANRLRSQGARLEVAAVDVQVANSRRQIEDIKAQAKLAEEQIKVDEQLLAKGLIVKQQVIASRQKVVDLSGQISAVEARITELGAHRFNSNTQPQQADADLRERIANLERTLAGQESELALATNVVSPYSGEVIEQRIDPGSMVAAGTPIVTIQPEVRVLEALIYLPSDNAKGAQAGQDVQISPSTVKREEFGFIKGKIVHVADYPATPAALMRNFQNEALVNSLTQKGPVTEVLVRLEGDARTPSGFKWSSSRGPTLVISSGTLCTGQVVTREQKPVTLVFPYIKEKLGLS
jgi:HlyD family secretion protein